MDILVTIPKSRLNYVAEEEQRVAEGLKKGEKWNFFWSIGRLPKKAHELERCYFLWNGAIRAYHNIVDLDEDMYCEHTDQFYPGVCLVLDPVIHEVDPIPMKGFQGFRYYEGGR